MPSNFVYANHPIIFSEMMCVSEVTYTDILAGLSLKQRFWGLNNIQIHLQSGRGRGHHLKRKKIKKPKTYLFSSFPFLWATSFSTALEKQTFGLWETVTKRKFLIQVCSVEKQLNDSLFHVVRKLQQIKVFKIFMSVLTQISLTLWAQANAFSFL